MVNIKKYLLALFVAPALFVFTAPLSYAAVDCTAANLSTADAIRCGAQGAGGNDATASEQSINETITSIVNVLSVIIAIVAVIMIILGGFRYITSAGASDKVTSAKNTIIYALIGLIIVALAQTIVRFVVDKTTTP
ncbi:MAG: hypothetical protein WD972_00865 [Candidatus Andersenbacteria bacterium]